MPIKKSIVIPVHGIHSFGHWHTELFDALNSTDLSFDFYPYKFGFFSVLFFLCPVCRNFQVRQFAKHFKRAVLNSDGRPIFIVAHSFGTYVVAKALRKLQAQKFEFEVSLLILAGSVLKGSYPISSLYPNVKRIINDCGSQDRALLLSQLFVFKTGMAGRVGFTGLNDDFAVNRVFNGGHGLYFERSDSGRSHMLDYWVPAIADPSSVSFTDFRSIEHSTSNDAFFSLFGVVKEYLYLLIFIYLGFLVFEYVKQY